MGGARGQGQSPGSGKGTPQTPTPAGKAKGTPKAPGHLMGVGGTPARA
jgi:hypothetical protein